MNFYPFHIGDYLSHTSHLSDAEDLAYRRMIDLYYQTEKPFSDIALVARKVKSSPETVKVILEEFFEFWVEDSTWRNKRADIEIAKYQYLSESGKKGAAKRWGKDKPMDTQCEPNSPPIATPIATKNQEPRTNISILTPKKASPKKKPIPEDFSISERVRDWATRKGFKNLEEHFEYFVDKCNQKGYLNVDWDLAFMNAIRDDWAKINISKNQTEYDPFKGAI
jgi:uncharacterized protein YdaU (DUF1376 family)